MLDLTEYKEYCVANEEFIYMLKDNSSIVYERLRDIFKVLGYIDMLTDTYGNIEEEYEVFYETGFPFLYKQIYIGLFGSFHIGCYSTYCYFV